MIPPFSGGKPFIIAAIAVLISSCCPRYPSVPIDLTGIIAIEADGYMEVRGFFSVESSKERFTLYLLDIYNTPRGTLTVHRGKVDIRDALIDEDIADLFMYWPFIFVSGGRVSYKEINGVSIRYGDWRNINDKEFPRLVDVEYGGMSIRLRLNYGN